MKYCITFARSGWITPSVAARGPRLIRAASGRRRLQRLLQLHVYATRAPVLELCGPGAGENAGSAIAALPAA